MEIINIIKAIVFGIIQGITEWLPISSTGHLIILNDLLKLDVTKEFMDIFLVVIQFGSILAVVLLFFNKLNPIKADKVERNKSIVLWLKILVASVPVGIIGFLFDDYIDTVLYNSVVVALALIVYGVIFIVMENKQREPKTNDLEKISFKQSIKIGLFQMLALVPGTSRSGSTIIGSMAVGTSRVVASEFSFFLAIPAMVGASGYRLLKYGFDFTSNELIILIVGTVTAFIVSIFAIKFLLNYIKKSNFKAFGYYRIVLGIIILLYFGLKLIF